MFVFFNLFSVILEVLKHPDMGIILILFFFKKIQKQSIRITDHTTSAKSFIKNCIISYLIFLYKLGIAGSNRIFLPALQNLFFIFHIKGLDSHYTIKKTIPLFNCLLNGKVLRFPDCISGHLSAEFFIMCQLQHRICKFLCVKSFRQVSCFSIIDNQIHRSCMECDNRKTKFKGFHDNHRPSFPPGRKKKNRRIQIILLRLICITDKINSVLNTTFLCICHNLIPEITGSDDIQLPFIILFTELFKGFHHQIKTFGIYKSCSHKETLGFGVAFSLTHEASGINFNFCINIQKFFVIALIIVTENNVSVQLRQIFLEQTFLFPEYNIRNIKISGITVMLPSDCLCIQLRRQHTQTKA